jgi:hypothetical protein
MRGRRAIFLAPLLALIALVVSACAPSPPVPRLTHNWAGYIVDGRSSAQPLRRVAGHFRVPTVTCPNANASLSLWVGFDGVIDFQRVPGGPGRPLFQTGVAAACGARGSRPIYYAWTEVAPAPPHNLSMQTARVRPGDVVDAYVTLVGPPSRPQVQMQLVDHGPTGLPGTILWHYSTQTPLINGLPLTAECVTERATDAVTGHEFPLAAFSIVVWGDSFTDGCQVSNRTAAAGQRAIMGNPYGWLVSDVQMLSKETGALLANPSGFTTLRSGRQAFQVAAHAPYFSPVQVSGGLRTPPTNLRFAPAR